MEKVPSPRPDWAAAGGRRRRHRGAIAHQPPRGTGLAIASQSKRNGASAPGPRNTAYVICRDGSGVVQVGEEEAGISAGEFVVWPAGLIHGLRSGLEGLTVLVIHPHTA